LIDLNYNWAKIPVKSFIPKGFLPVTKITPHQILVGGKKLSRAGLF